MRRVWDYAAVLLYVTGIILVCLLSLPPRADEAGIVPVPPSGARPETAEAPDPGTAHLPDRDIRHRYDFSAGAAERGPNGENMLSKYDFKNGKYYYAPEDAVFHVYHEENGAYDSFVYGSGPVGETDGWARYIFRYDARTRQAVSYIQEQYLDTGSGMGPGDLSVYARQTGYLLDAVFSGTKTQTGPDKEKVEALALAFFLSYIPAHRSVPAILHIQMPAYFLTFVMDADLFITMISPGAMPDAYLVEAASD